MNQIPENIDVNILEILNTQLDSHIDDSKNVLGFSDAPYCLRKLVLKKLHNIKTKSNNKMLFGKIYEEILYRPEVLRAIRDKINSQLGITKKQAMIPRMEDMWEFIPGHFIRLHPDIFSIFYIIEVKTTFIYVKYWTKDLLSYQVAQLNGYLGYYKQQLGFIHKINGQVFQSGIKQSEKYWEKLWLDYGYFLPIQFNKELYEDTLKRIKFTFECIENKKIPQVDCEFDWECRYCPVLKECGKSEVKCRNRNKMGKLCQNKMYEWEECLSDKFIENPICKNCFSKSHPRFNEEILEKKYNEYKFIKKYLWS